jgi:hypothetical protein
MFNMLILMAIVMAALGFILYQMISFSLVVNNPVRLAKKDGSALRSVIGPHLEDLVPLTNAEMELFSLSKETRRIRKSGHLITTGVFKSIYHEPLCAFAYKEYKRKNVSTLLARTVDQEFFYMSIKGETQVYVNGKAYGVITGDGSLLTPNKSEQLAAISPEDILELHPVTIGNKEIGTVLNPRQNELPNPRAFQLLDDLNEEEKTRFLSLSILSLVEESIF